MGNSSVAWPAYVQAGAAVAVAAVAILALIFNMLLVRRTTDYVNVTREVVEATRDATAATRDAVVAAERQAEAATRAAVAAEEEANLLRLQYQQSREVQEREAAPSLRIEGATKYGKDMPNKPLDIYQVRNGGPGNALRVRVVADGLVGTANPIRAGEMVEVRPSMAPTSHIPANAGPVEIFSQDVLGNFHRFSGELHEVWRTGSPAPDWAELAR